MRPDPEVCLFYNRIVEEYLKIPGTKEFFNGAADFLLFDLATLPFTKELTPLVLGMASDIFGSIFGLFTDSPKGGRKKKQIVKAIDKKYAESESGYPSSALKIEVSKIIEKNPFKAYLLPSLVVLSAFVGYFIGGFGEKTARVIESNPNMSFTFFLFIGGLGISGIGVLIYGSRLETRVLLILSLLASIFAFINEFLLMSIDYLVYLEGDLITLFFAVLGYPIFIIFIFGFSDWIIKYSHLPNFKSRIVNSLPVLGVFVLILILFVVEDLVSLFRNAQLLATVSTSLMLIAMVLFGLYYGFHHSYRQNLTLIVIGALLGAVLEIIGFTCDYWIYYTPSVPLSIVILWSIRILALGGLMTLMNMRILKHGSDTYAITRF